MKTNNKNIRCPECNGKAVPLQKLSEFKVEYDALIHIETYQPYRCKRCKKEFKLK
jgi:DNA-directed RNA polymerase subunit RPC12/RpoP